MLIKYKLRNFEKKKVKDKYFIQTIFFFNFIKNIFNKCVENYKHQQELIIMTHFFKFGFFYIYILNIIV